jgi:hypothetical protein
MRLALILALVAPTLANACFSPGFKLWVPLTAADLDRHGSFTFAVEPSAAFRATAGALQAEGYEVALVNEDKGFVVTKPKLMRLDAQARHIFQGYVHLDAHAAEVQIRAELEALGPKMVRIRLVPISYVNGNRAERVRWNYFFLRRTWSTLLGRIYEALPNQRGGPGALEPPRPGAAPRPPNVVPF